MADYEAGPDGGVIIKGSLDAQPKVQDVVAPEAVKPEESTAGAASSDVQPTTAKDAAEASATASEGDQAAEEVAKDAAKPGDGEDSDKEGASEAEE